MSILAIGRLLVATKSSKQCMQSFGDWPIYYGKYRPYSGIKMVKMVLKIISNWPQNGLKVFKID